MMKLFLPKNIFTEIFAKVLPADSGIDLIYKESPLIVKQLESDTSAIALIPSLELINHRELFVSRKSAVSFDGVLSNTYFYFVAKERKVERIALRGDASINEVLLTKILFDERFGSSVELTLDPSKEAVRDKDFAVVGYENFISWNFEKGFSLADELADMLDHPYVNFIFVSADKDSLDKFNSLVSGIDLKIEENISTILNHSTYNDNVKDFVKSNLGSVYFEITQNEVDALNELIKLIFYKGVVDDIFDLKFV